MTERVKRGGVFIEQLPPKPAPTPMSRGMADAWRKLEAHLQHKLGEGGDGCSICEVEMEGETGINQEYSYDEF